MICAKNCEKLSKFIEFIQITVGFFFPDPYSLGLYRQRAEFTKKW